MYTIVLIEDCKNTGSVLLEYFQPGQPSELARLTDKWNFDFEAPWEHPAGQAYEPGMGERAAGQLGHLRQGLEALEGGADAVLPVLFPLTQIPQLVAASHIEDDEVQKAGLQSLLKEHTGADSLDSLIMVIDLALGHGEAKLLDNAGARDTVDGRPRTRRTFRDPRQTLTDTSGFRIMRAFAGTIPVIVTSYSSSPLVKQLCLVNGAFAVVEKPVPQRDEKTNFDMFTAAKQKVHARENSARQNENALDVVVTHYATTIVSEVLKAISFSLFSADPPRSDQ